MNGVDLALQVFCLGLSLAIFLRVLVLKDWEMTRLWPLIPALGFVALCWLTGCALAQMVDPLATLAWGKPCTVNCNETGDKDLDRAVKICDQHRKVDPEIGLHPFFQDGWEICTKVTDAAWTAIYGKKPAEEAKDKAFVERVAKGIKP